MHNISLIRLSLIEGFTLEGFLSVRFRWLRKKQDLLQKELARGYLMPIAYESYRH